MLLCGTCRHENDDDADFCEQCGGKLYKGADAEADAEASGPPPCPSCGGQVELTTPGKGVCTVCGEKLQAVEFDDAPEGARRGGSLGGLASPDPSPTVESRELAEAIKKRLRQGLSLERAVDAACAEFFASQGGDSSAAEPGAPAATSECPVCGHSNKDDARRCSGCGLYFQPPKNPVTCPRCGEQALGDKCSCGAVLTLRKLVANVEPSVLYVCPRCRSLFTTVTVQCPDCGETVLWAGRLKAYAETPRD